MIARLLDETRIYHVQFSEEPTEKFQIIYEFIIIRNSQFFKKSDLDLIFLYIWENRWPMESSSFGQTFSLNLIW